MMTRAERSYMKALTFTSKQYTSSKLTWTNLYECNATDFVFIPPAYPTTAGDSSAMAAVIKKLIDNRAAKTTNIYIGTPGITSSLKAGKVCYRDAVAVIKNKLSNTQIGYEMEFNVAAENCDELYS